MDTSVLKNFAKAARQSLRQQAEDRAKLLGLRATGLLEAREVAGGFVVGGQSFDVPKLIYDNLRGHLLALQEQQGGSLSAALELLTDEVAYTWFNRLCALRYMEANNYHRRVLSSGPSADSDQPADPEALQQAPALAEAGELLGIKAEDLRRERQAAEQSGRPGDGAVYRQVIIGTCRKLALVIPAIFDGGREYLELFLPDTLLLPNSVVRQLVAIDDQAWQQIEIIGWLYQFYIAEEKDNVMKSKQKYSAKDIPPATQLFTPNWIVRYLVENSLGRLWLEAHPTSPLRQHMPYYLAASSENPTPAPNPDLKPQELTVLDPACGSGHILVYAFDLLVHIYRECGYNDSDIAAEILRYNLHGLDIDERAAQLATFAVLMKARALNPRLLRQANAPTLHICAVLPTKHLHFAKADATTSPSNSDMGPLFGAVTTIPAPVYFGRAVNSHDWQPLIAAFADADYLGSLITPPDYDQKVLEAQIVVLEDDSSLGSENETRALRRVLKQSQLLKQKYAVVVANPPFMGSNRFANPIKNFAATKYKDFKDDLFSMFIVRCLEMAKDGGQLGFMTPFVWMFISSYQELRERIVENHTITSLVQLEYSGFDGATVPICTFTLLKNHLPAVKGEYVRLSDFRGAAMQSPKTLEAAANPNCGYRFSADASAFAKIPGSPIAYWASEKVLEAFEKGERLENYMTPVVGVRTGDAERFVRAWFEVSHLMLDADGTSSEKFWKKLHRGGEYRKWYGNLENVINYKDSGEEIRIHRVKTGQGASLPGESYFFLEGITWTSVTSHSTAFRFMPAGSVFEGSGMGVFVGDGVSVNSSLGYLRGECIFFESAQDY
jgi:SAM-dependent methyltransferase